MALVALAGCDKMLSLNDITPPPDAPPGCTGIKVPPFFCADFDEQDAVAYESGVMVTLPNPPANVTVQRVPPNVSPPYALWIDSQMPAYIIDDTQSSPTVTQLSATFSLAVTRPSAQDAELFELGVHSVTFDCYAQLYIKADPTMPALWVKSVCPTQQQVQVLSALPAVLTPVAMTFDVAAGTTTVQVEQADAVLMMDFQNPTGGTPHVKLGMLGTGGAGPKVGFDNVIVSHP